MIKPRIILCSGAALPDAFTGREDLRVIPLETIGSTGTEPNVTLLLENITDVFAQSLTHRLVDLLEIAAYVYAADSSTNRGEGWCEEGTREPWSREFHFVIPVRDVGFWQQDEVRNRLVQTLNFLSDDQFTFDFLPLERDRPASGYLEFDNPEGWPLGKVDRVVMFSGGLDSLAGAVERARAGESLVLVSHRPVTNLSHRQKTLFEELRRFSDVPMLHIPVWVNKAKPLGQEYSQRTRSFLFSALGIVVAEFVKADGVVFYENGVVSLNLPIADEVLRARASRTTHPLALSYLCGLYKLVLGREFVLENPYLFHTKTDVVKTLIANGAAKLIPYTRSCAHGYFVSNTQSHCGGCSQCIDRRTAVLAAGAEAHDPWEDYKIEVFTGPRKDGYEKNMAVGFARHALEMDRMGEDHFATAFNTELTRAVRPLPHRSEAAARFYEMHRRHAAAVNGVLGDQLRQNAESLLKGELPKSSMLYLVAQGEPSASGWVTYADRLTTLIQVGVPRICQTEKPKTEPRLQEICDGILASYDCDLKREFPFMRWSSGLTKPDWSQEAHRLWVEAKYVRKKAGLRQITEDIAADITKYGDNGRRVLYVIYDPEHLVLDEREFSREILRRDTMMVRFVR